jgi:phosphoribosylamine--glycine ligase
MKVLVVGSGGREHALCLAISKSPLLTQLLCAPGNPGIAQVAECVPIDTHQIRDLVNFCNVNQIDLVIPGPEAPLANGLKDALEVFSIPCCGPSKAAAMLESSKTFTKILCDEAGIPTAAWKGFTDPTEAIEYIKGVVTPVVIKYDGLAAGKGVTVVHSIDQGIEVITDIMVNHKFDTPTIVIEECLYGPEMSVFALCNGSDAISLDTAQDYKRLTGHPDSPNTGGMGAISPSPLITEELHDEIWRSIIQPTLDLMDTRGTPFRGILYAGIMLTDEGPQLIEFNVRFGDPECQSIIPRLKSDLLEALYKAATGAAQSELKFSDDVCASVVMAAPGYPDRPEKGSVIRLTGTGDATVLHAGTIMHENQLIANGGRVLTVTAKADSMGEAVAKVYNVIRFHIDWPEGIYRGDIGT